MRRIDAEPYRVTPRRGMVIALYLASTLLLLIVILQIALRPPRDLYGPIVWWAQYRDASAGAVVQDLERRKVIPPGTRWDDPALATRRTSFVLVLATPGDALEGLAMAAALTIRYKVGYHGDLIAAPRISAASGRGGAALPETDRKLESEMLSR